MMRRITAFGTLAALLAAGYLLILGLALINRLGPDRAVLVLDECRFNRALPHMFSTETGLTLRTATLYQPKGEARPAGAVLLSFAFTPPDPAPKRAWVALESDGPAVAAWRQAWGDGQSYRPLILRDVASEREVLRRRYSGRTGLVVTEGSVQPLAAPLEGHAPFQLALRRADLHLSARQRRFLAGLPPQTADGCVARFEAELIYGALGTPYVAAVRPLSPAQ